MNKEKDKSTLKTNELSSFSTKMKEKDYYFNDKGLMVFTEKYHLNRGYCCKNGCLHCPYPNK